MPTRTPPARTGYRARYPLLAAVLALGCLVRFLLAGTPASADPPTEFRFHHDHILGTSLDLVVFAPSETEAEACEQSVLDEIERLRQILSTYDLHSAIGRLNRASSPMPCPPELIDVLRAYEVWNRRSGGAFNGQLGDLIRAWKEAEKAGAQPDPTALARIVEQLGRPGWRIDDAGHTVERLTAQPLNVNSIGKGYIIGKATVAGRAKVPSVTGLLVNIGGDMTVAGTCGRAGADWRIAITDPSRSEDNAVPLTELRLKGGAVATSAAYERGYTIASRRYSHIFDPRTGRPAEGVASATVVAGDSVTANALATTLCVLTPEQGLTLVAATPGARCLLVAADGRQFRSPSLKDVEAPHRAAAADEGAQPGKWPEGYQATITLTLLTPKARPKRPYAAVWIEDASGKPIRTLTVWGNRPKYQRDLTAWWKFASGDKDLIMAVTRATRPPGRYQIVWDGKDDKGNPVDAGTYTVRVEVHREHGKHVQQSGKIECGADKATATLSKTEETEETKVDYGPKGK